MKRKLSLLAITTSFSLIGWANVNLKTEPKSILPVWSQTAGSLRLTVDGPDFRGVSAGRPYHVRIRLTKGFRVSETLVAPQFDPNLRDPINLALRLECDDGAVIAAPADAVQIVRWKQDEREIWLRINHDGLWVQGRLGERALPDREHPVSFDLGVAWDHSLFVNRNAYEHQCANIAFNQRNSGEGAHTFLRVTPSELPETGVLRVDTIAFENCRGVEAAEFTSQVLIGDNTAANFVGEDTVANVGPTPRQFMTHVPNIFNYESALVVTNRNDWTESIDLVAVSSFGATWSRPLEVGPGQTMNVDLWELYEFQSFLIDSLSIVADTGIGGAIQIQSSYGTHLIQPGKTDWGRLEHRLRVHHGHNEYHGLALFGLERGTPINLELLDDESRLIHQFTLRKFLAPGAKHLEVLDVFTEAFPEAAWVHIQAQEPIGVDSLVGSELGVLYPHAFLTPSLAMTPVAGSFHLVPRLNAGMVVYAYNFHTDDQWVVIEGFDFAGNSVGKFSQLLPSSASLSLHPDKTFPYWVYLRAVPEESVAYGYGLSQTDSVLKVSESTIATEFQLVGQQAPVDYRVFAINMSDELAVVEVHHKGPESDWWESLPDLQPEGVLSVTVVADQRETLTFESSQPLAVTVTHRSGEKTLAILPLVLKKPLFDDLRDVEDDGLRLRLLELFDEDRDGLLSPTEVDSAQEIDCSGRRIRSLNGIEHFQSLESLVACRNELSALPDLSNLQNLMHMDLSANNLVDFPPLETLTKLLDVSVRSNPVVIPGDLPVGPHLRTLDLRDTIRSGVPRLLGAAALETVSFSVARVSAQVCPDFAELRDSGIDVRLFMGSQPIHCHEVSCRGLSYLAISDSVLKQILLDRADFDADGRLCVDEVQQITRLDISNQGIQDLGGLSGLFGLQELDCSNNQIQSLAGLEGLSALTVIDCSGNRIIGLDVLARTPALVELDCANNRIDTLSGIGELTHLLRLNASFNPLSNLDDIESLALEELVVSGAGLARTGSLPQSLKLLDLSDNILLPEDIQLYLPNLRWLDLSGNQLRQLPDLELLVSLRTLRCSNNLLGLLPNLETLTSLTYLDCSHNELTEVAIPTQWNSLDVSHNALHGLPNLKDSNLSVLDISHNAFQSLAFLQGKERIHSLKASNNQLSRVGELQHIRCEVLDLSHNQLDRVPQVPTGRFLYAPDLDIRFNRISVEHCEEIRQYWSYLPGSFEFNPQSDGAILDCSVPGD